MLPRVLMNFGVFIDGRGYLGRADEVQLPKLAVKTEEFRAGGMDSPVELDMGTEKLECKITLAEYDREAAKLFGLFNAGTPVTLRGAIQRQGEAAVPVVVRLIGGVKENDKGNWKAGERGSMALTFALHSYTEEIDGEETIHIDSINCIRRVGGVDQLESIRAAIGA